MFQSRVREWLNSHQEKIIFFEGDDEIILKRQDKTLVAEVQLTLTSPDNSTLQSWMRLGDASRIHYYGALSQRGEGGTLWLVQNVPDMQNHTHILACLEALLNQRDTWRAIRARLAHSAPPPKPTSLRSLSY